MENMENPVDIHLYYCRGNSDLRYSLHHHGSRIFLNNEMSNRLTYDETQLKKKRKAPFSLAVPSQNNHVIPLP